MHPLPKDPQAKVQIYNAEIAPGGYTNWHCHNGATFFIALQGIFEAEFEERCSGEGQGWRRVLRADRQGSIAVTIPIPRCLICASGFVSRLPTAIT